MAPGLSTRVKKKTLTLSQAPDKGEGTKRALGISDDYAHGRWSSFDQFWNLGIRIGEAGAFARLGWR